MICKMFVFYVLLSMILNFQTLSCVNHYYNTESDLVVIGKYPDLKNWSINNPECGKRFIPTIPEILLDVMKSCVGNNYSSKAFETIRGIGPRFQSVPPQSRVYKGLLTSRCEAPWTVAIIGKGFLGSSLCTGSLITFEWVLTAAHCGEGWSSATDVKIWAGSNRRDEGEVRNKNKWIPHPNFVKSDSLSAYPIEQQEQKLSSDIALLKLNKPFIRQNEGGSYILNTICLPRLNALIYAPGPATFFGFGLKEHWSKYFKVTSDYLLKGDVNLDSYFSCPFDVYCAHFNAGSMTIPCPGDSGGPLVRYVEPLFARGVLIGVMRGVRPGPAWHDFRYCQQDLITLGLWTSVPLNMHWILETIKDN